MLIAMMAKTFDNVWEASELNTQVLFAKAVFFQSHRAPEPPPFNVLRLPYSLASTVLWLMRLLTPDSCRRLASLLDVAVNELTVGFEFSPHVDASDTVAANLADETNEYVGLESAGRNTLRSWKKGVEINALRERLIEYVTTHEDDVAQEERWRANMLKRITSSVHASRERVEAKVAAQQDALDSVQASLALVLDALRVDRQQATGTAPAAPTGFDWRAHAEAVARADEGAESKLAGTTPPPPSHVQTSPDVLGTTPVQPLA